MNGRPELADLLQAQRLDSVSRVSWEMNLPGPAGIDLPRVDAGGRTETVAAVDPVLGSDQLPQRPAAAATTTTGSCRIFRLTGDMRPAVPAGAKRSWIVRYAIAANPSTIFFGRRCVGDISDISVICAAVV